MLLLLLLLLPRCKETGESKCILTALCGHGHFDMASYEKYLSGEMQVCRV
jgi:tryptophan synthase beta chain